MNRLPAITLTAPTPLIVGATIALTADASDSDGTIASVEFFRDAISLGTDATAPFTASWINAAAGPHTLRAKATDAQGAIAYSPALAVIVKTPYQHWADTAGLTPAQSDFLADPDHDGIANGLEFALGLDPLAHSANALPQASLFEENGQRFLTLTVPRNEDAATLSFTVEVSAALATWNSGPAHTTVLDDTPTLLRVRDNTPIAPGVRRFIRLKVTP